QAIRLDSPPPAAQTTNQPHQSAIPRRATSTIEPMVFVRTALGAERRWNALSLALLIAAGLVVVLTFADYGVTWDEDVHNWYGYFALDYYLSLFSDQRALNWLNLYNYGAAFDMIAAAFNKFSPL